MGVTESLLRALCSNGADPPPFYRACALQHIEISLSEHYANNECRRYLGFLTTELGTSYRVPVRDALNEQFVLEM